MAENFFEYCVPTKVLFGCGKLNELHRQTFPGKKAMLVISKGYSVKAYGALDRTEMQLKKANIDYVIFDKVGANPTKGVVEDGARFAKANACDFVIALGGGSVMDAAKVMAMLAHQESGDLWDYAGGFTGKKQPATGDILPLIAITTTAGTGSEVDPWGVITNPETKEKIDCGGDPRMFPVLAVVDPELMWTVPPKLTAYQGFDALFHATEGFISANANFMSDMVGLAVMENVGKYLPNAVNNGIDLDARTHMALANTLAGYSMVFSSCTSKHSMQHALGAYHPELPHGAGLIMLSVEYYRFFAEKHICDERFIRMAKALGVENASEPMDFVRRLEELLKECGVAELKMSDYGITPEEFPTMAANARAIRGGRFSSDLYEMTEEECIGIYQRSYR